LSLTASFMLFTDISDTVAEVSATRSRKTKTRAIANCLQRCSVDELPIVASWCSGIVPQGRLGVGWAALFRDDTGFSARAGGATVPTLTICEVDAIFTTLSETSGVGSQATRSTVLANLFTRATQPETDLLVGLLSGQLRQGALGGVVLDAIALAFDSPASAVRRAHLLSGDIGLAAQHAAKGTLGSVVLEVGRGIQPMLASTAKNLSDAMTELGEVAVEWKLDGARIQVHKHTDETVTIFTRNLNDITERLPEVARRVRELPCESVVLDGEVLAVDEQGRPRMFQDTIGEFAADAPGNIVLSPYFFDIMHLDGIDLLDEPLSTRRAALGTLVGDMQIPGLITYDLDAATAVQDVALGLGHEGVMVKSAASLYEAGRRGSTWQKVKPVRTFDLVVIAAEWGHGRRQGWLSNLHLGARDPKTGEFVMVGKTFKGLTDKLLEWQTAAFLEHEIRRTQMTVYVRPELVVEIAIDGVQRSTRYLGGVALRFARVKSYRSDKRADEADTITSLQALLPM
jgi:DNA ligase 1